MNLIPGSLLFGVAPAILVDCAEQLRDHTRGFDQEAFCIALGAPWREASPVLDHMVEAGFVEKSADGLFRPTKRMRQLALASITTGLSREEADALLAKIITKAQTINADAEHFPCGVRRIAVFGSYLSGKTLLGDLDIAVEIMKRRGPKPVFKGIEALIRADTAAVNKTYAALRMRQPKLISLHNFDELEVLETPFEVVFESR